MIKMTIADWLTDGSNRFSGADQHSWKFVCLVCGHVQSAEMFKPYREQGATPESACKECLGRYLPKDECSTDLGSKGKVKQPCDYASYGLFNLCPILLVDKDLDKPVPVFGFAEDEIEL